MMLGKRGSRKQQRRKKMTSHYHGFVSFFWDHPNFLNASIDLTATEDQIEPANETIVITVDPSQQCDRDMDYIKENMKELLDENHLAKDSQQCKLLEGLLKSAKFLRLNQLIEKYDKRK